MLLKIPSPGFSHLSLSVMSLDHHFFEREQDLHHQVLKENGQTRDDATLLRVHLPVLALVQHLNV